MGNPAPSLRAAGRLDDNRSAWRAGSRFAGEIHRAAGGGTARRATASSATWGGRGTPGGFATAATSSACGSLGSPAGWWCPRSRPPPVRPLGGCGRGLFWERSSKGCKGAARGCCRDAVGIQLVPTVAEYYMQNKGQRHTGVGLLNPGGGGGSACSLPRGASC